MNDLLLWEIEEKYYENLERRIEIAKSGCKLRDFLELGFNNATLMDSYDGLYNRKVVRNLYMDVDLVGNKSYHRTDLTEEMLDCEVVLDGTCKDADGYTIAYIYLENEDDWKYFKEIEG